MVDAPAVATPSRDAPASPAGAPFGLSDWGLLAAIALMWGSSFLLIEIALESFPPQIITVLRLFFGASILVWFRQARVPIERDDWRPLILLAIFWMAAPFLLFPIAQQWIDSSLAGMINGGVPVFASSFAAIATRRVPGARQIVGISIGFIGVLVVSWPAVQGAEATALGAALVLAGTISYGIAINIAVPLQQRYGSLAVLLRTQGIALALTLVPAVLSLPDASFGVPSLVATIPLGIFGTGLAFVLMATLVGRVGAARGSITIYFIPIVAIALGAFFRNETIAFISLIGTALVLLGAYLTSRSR